MPSVHQTTRSAMARSGGTSWPVTTTAQPTRARRRNTAPRRSPSAGATSRSGSSARRHAGARVTAAATFARRRSPPLSVCGSRWRSVVDAQQRERLGVGGAAEAVHDRLELRADRDAAEQQVAVGEEEEPRAREPREPRTRDRSAEERHGAVVGRCQPRRDTQQRRLARAVAAEQHGDRAGVGAQRARREHAPRAERLPHAVDVEDSHGATPRVAIAATSRLPPRAPTPRRPRTQRGARRRGSRRAAPRRDGAGPRGTARRRRRRRLTRPGAARRASAESP